MRVAKRYRLRTCSTRISEIANNPEILEAIQYVDLVIPETCWEQKVTDVKEHSVDIFVIGEDWAGEFDFLNDHCEVVYLSRTKDISTSFLKGKML